jgi:hypothetical protein
MAQTINQGMKSTAEMTFTDSTTIIPTHYVDKVLAVITKSAGQFRQLAKFNKETPSPNRTVNIGEDLLIKNTTTLASAYTASGTSMVVAAGTGSYAASRNMVLNRDKPGSGRHLVMKIATDTWTIKPDVDGGTATNGDVGDEIIILGQFIEEGGPAPLAKNVEYVKRTYYIPHHGKSLEFTDEARRSGSWFRVGDYDYQKNKQFLIEFVRDGEMNAVWAGLSAAWTLTGEDWDPVEKLGRVVNLPPGFLTWMEANADADHNVFDLDLTKREFMNHRKPMFYAESEPRNKEQAHMFHGPEFANGVAGWFEGQGRFELKVSKGAGPQKIGLGFSFTQWDSPFGVIRMNEMEHLDSRSGNGRNYYFTVYRPYMSWQTFKSGNTEFDTRIIMNMVPSRYFETVDCIHEYATPIFRQPNMHFVGSFLSTS